MTADAAEGEAHEGLADLDHLRVDVIGLHLRLVRVHDLDVAHHEEAGGGDLGGVVFGGLRWHQIARDLLADELVKRFVGVEGVDQVIAIPPRMLGIDAVRGAHHVRVAGEIEPVPRPALAVGFGVEKAVHHLFECLRRGVALKSPHILLVGRQAGKIE